MTLLIFASKNDISLPLAATTKYDVPQQSTSTKYKPLSWTFWLFSERTHLHKYLVHDIYYNSRIILCKQGSSVSYFNSSFYYIQIGRPASRVINVLNKGSVIEGERLQRSSVKFFREVWASHDVECIHYTCTSLLLYMYYYDHGFAQFKRVE